MVWRTWSNRSPNSLEFLQCSADIVWILKECRFHEESVLPRQMKTSAIQKITYKNCEISRQISFRHSVLQYRVNMLLKTYSISYVCEALGNWWRQGLKYEM